MIIHHPSIRHPQCHDFELLSCVQNLILHLEEFLTVHTTNSRSHSHSIIQCSHHDSVNLLINHLTGFLFASVGNMGEKHPCIVSVLLHHYELAHFIHRSYVVGYRYRVKITKLLPYGSTLEVPNFFLIKNKISHGSMVKSHHSENRQSCRP